MIDERQNLLRFRRVFMIVWLCAACLAAAIYLIAFLNGRIRFDAYSRVVEFNTCSGAASDGAPLIAGQFSYKSGLVYACGLLQTNVPTTLAFYWYRADEKQPFYFTSEYDLEDGYFYSQLPLEYTSAITYYHVDVYLGREKLASQEFEIGK